MGITLVLRCEFVCAVFIAVLAWCHMTYSRKKEKNYLSISIIAFIHVVLNGVTIYTVNNADKVEPVLNIVLHDIYYFTAVAFCVEVFSYIVKNAYSKQFVAKFLPFFRLPAYLYPLICPFCKIDYIHGEDTWYSMGLGVIIAFSMVAAYAVLGTILLIINFKKMERNVAVPLIGLTAWIVVAMLMQFFFHELLITGMAITIVVLGIFVTLENPSEELKNFAYIDADTGIKNKTCYTAEFEMFENKCYKDKKTDICAAVFDLNGLKKVNDNFGHQAGDELINAAADALSKILSSAYNIYRTGGDEFVAFFVGNKAACAEKEMALLREMCRDYKNPNHPLSIAAGMALQSADNAEDLAALVSLADKRMYADKQRIKAENPEISVR
ncbi:MAG: GGDEF domain-containing protein [Huintestinicola sp.]